MNLAQVEAYLADDVPAFQRIAPLAHWAAKQPNPRLWLALSEMKRYDIAAFRESLALATPPKRRLGAFKRRNVR